MVTVPSAFTERTGRDHWELLLRACAVENQVFIVAADQIGEAPPHYRSFGRSLIVDPWGSSSPRLRTASASSPPSSTSLPRTGSGRACPRCETGERAPTLAPGRGRRPVAEPATAGRADGQRAGRQAPGDPRRRDPSLRPAGPTAPGIGRRQRGRGRLRLVYHYFDSKDQMLNELFSERWSLLLDASEKVQEGEGSVGRSSAGSPASSSSPTGTSPT